MTVTRREARQWASLHLKKAGITGYNYESALLLALCLGKTLAQVYTWPGEPVTGEEEKEYRRLVQERARGLPYHYLAGEKEFMGMPFKVNPGVLIPRPETEILVEGAVEWAAGHLSPGKGTPGKKLKILDLCTGSGVIGITLACLLPGSSLWAVDISPEALETARDNARLLGVQDRSTFLLGDLWEPLKKIKNRPPSPVNRPPFPVNRLSSPGTVPSSPGTRPPFPGTRPPSPGNRPPSLGTVPSSPGSRPPSPGTRLFSPGTRPLFDLVVSNPPYIPSHEMPRLPREVRAFEPALALDGGPGGLAFFRRILAQVHLYLASPGALFLEIGAGQGEKVTGLARQTGIFPCIKVTRDYQGIERVVAGLRNKQP